MSEIRPFPLPAHARPYPELEALHEEFREVVGRYVGRVPTVAVIGVLHLMMREIIEDAEQ